MTRIKYTESAKPLLPKVKENSLDIQRTTYRQTNMTYSIFSI